MIAEGITRLHAANAAGRQDAIRAAYARHATYAGAVADAFKAQLEGLIDSGATARQITGLWPLPVRQVVAEVISSACTCSARQRRRGDIRHACVTCQEEHAPDLEDAGRF